MLCASLHIQVKVHKLIRLVCNDVACVGCDLWLHGMSLGSNEGIISTSINANILKE